ncbi:MAG: hypothetical protein V5A52_07625 [Halovenus sp.]|uniref:hypothetical protein n=1 Tax=Halovenus amylolytica TaxID=2500550 RepID=UPI000FE2D733
MLSKLLNYIRGRFRTGKSNAEMNPTEVPQYGESVNYLPCDECGEGSMQYDPDVGAAKCTVCGAIDEGPDQ